MLIQLHFQHRDGTTEMRAQKEINTNDEMRTFVAETQKFHTLPNKAI